MLYNSVHFFPWIKKTKKEQEDPKGQKNHTSWLKPGKTILVLCRHHLHCLEMHSLSKEKKKYILQTDSNIAFYLPGITSKRNNGTSLTANRSVSVSGLRGLGGGSEALERWAPACSEEAALSALPSLLCLWRNHLSSECFLGLPSLPTPSLISFFHRLWKCNGE